MAPRATALTLLLAAGADAKAYTWRGIIDNQWTTSNNWEPATSAAGPGDSPSDAVTIDDNEGKNALVELTVPKSIATLNMGDKLGIKATLRVLNQLTVSQQLNVQRNGILELNAGLAAISCPDVEVNGVFHFHSGYITGTYNIQASGTPDFGSANYQGSKTFDNAKVTIASSAIVTAGGPWLMGSNAAITSSVGIDATGNNFQITLKNATTSKGNSVAFPSFNWTQ